MHGGLDQTLALFLQPLTPPAVDRLRPGGVGVRRRSRDVARQVRQAEERRLLRCDG